MRTRRHVDPAALHAVVGSKLIDHEVLTRIDSGGMIALQEIADHGRELIAQPDALADVSVLRVGVEAGDLVEALYCLERAGADIGKVVLADAFAGHDVLARQILLLSLRGAEQTEP